MIGFSVTGQTSRAPGTEFAPNAFIRIDSSGRVRVVLPKSEMGQGISTSISMLVAEELEVDLEHIQIEIPPGEPDRFKPVSQGTGGSTSIRETWEPVSSAAAAARMMLVSAAASRWNVRAGECRAKASSVYHEASGRRATYGDLAAAAARLPVPKTIVRKDPKTYQVIGHSVPRLDAKDKVTGEAIYGIDVKLPGLRVAALRASPVIGGKVKSFDESNAGKAARGVVQIINLGDIIAVVASNFWTATQTLNSLNVMWEEGANHSLHQDAITTRISAALDNQGVLAGEAGNMTNAMKTASRRISATYEQPFLAHATMEPANCTVHVTATSCEVWVGTQVPDDAKLAAMRVTKLASDAVTIHNHTIGGGFGRRLETDMVEIAIRIGQSITGPVKVIWSREEDIQHDLYRPYYCDRLSAGLDTNGRPVAWSHRIAGSSIIARLYPSSFKGVDSDAVEGAVETPYVLPNNRVEFSRQESPVTTSWWRGVGPLRSIFVVESFIDELAAATGADPVAYRRSLLRDDRAKAVLDLVAEKSGWSRPRPGGIGFGVSILHSWDTYLAQVAEVEVDRHGTIRVKRVTAVIDCGQPINPLGIEAQLQGGIIFGVTAALYGEITFDAGRVQQSNFHDYRVLRMNEVPLIDCHIITNHEKPGGVGEPPTAGAAAAVANAVFAATGKRIRKLPLAKALST